jgi:hypothetical protein
VRISQHCRDASIAKTIARAIASFLSVLLIAQPIAFAGIDLATTPQANNPLTQFFFPPQNVFVLAIGIGQYKNPNLNLANSVRDANAVSATAARTFKSSALTAISLTDSNATKAGIRDAIQQFALKSHASDLFILSFSGQALMKSKNGTQESYLAPSDAVVPEGCDNEACIDESSFISGALLNSWMTQMHAQRQILLLDTNNTDQLLPIFENRWRKESCAVGHDAAKRLLIATNHGDGLEDPVSGGILTNIFLKQLALLHDKGLSSAFRLQQSIYATNDPGGETDPKLRDTRRFMTFAQMGPRVELLGGDFVIDGPPAGVKPADLLRDSGFGTLCYNDPENATRGFEPEPDKSAAAAPQPNKPTNYALVIASDHYKNWHTLSNPIFDGTTIETDLAGTYGFKVEHLWDPTRDQLRHKLDELHAKHFNDQDQLFIFIAGHGDYDETNDIGYLVFPDTPLGHVYDSEMNLQELRQRVDTIPAKHIFLVMDSCFAGSLDPSLGGASRGAYDPIPLEKLQQRTADKKTRYFLTSGGKEYVPDGTPGNHSPFASLFILALEKGSKQAGYLNLAQMPHYFERLGTIPRAGNLGHNEDGADFFFIPTTP